MYNLLNPISGYSRVLAGSRSLVETLDAYGYWFGALFSAAALAACLPTAVLNERSMVSDETQETHHLPASATDDMQQAPEQTQGVQRYYAIYNQQGDQRRAPKLRIILLSSR